MTLKESIAYMEYVSKTGSILGLTSIINLMNELDNVQEKLHIIHIAGTNGKGSVGAFLESALIEAGYSVGRYTSPVVFEPFEVWRINRINISTEDYLTCLSKVKEACERMLSKGMAQPTSFEVETALAFLYFYEKKCDYVLLEVGMGGETDATNLIRQPAVSVLTSISMDHMQFLGDTLEQIATVKAGIIKKNCPVVTSNTQNSEALKVIEEMAKKKEAPLFLAKQETVKELQVSMDRITFEHQILGNVELCMSGCYQVENANIAITVLREVLHIEDSYILQGIKKTKWPGRFEVIANNPTVILDGAHNIDAAEKLYTSLKMHFTNRRITYIIGVLADKEHEKILDKMLPLAAQVYTVTPPSPRALSGETLAEEVRSFGKEAIFCDSMEVAVKKALLSTKKEDVIVAFGSLSYLAVLKNACMEVLHG